MEQRPSKKYSALPKRELNIVYEIAEDILNNLPSSAVDELFEGSDKDITNLLIDFLYDVNNVVNNNGTTLSEYNGLDKFAESFDESLKIQSYNYFKTTMLPNFNQGWRNLEWGNLIQLHPWSAYLCQRGSGKCYLSDTQVVMYDGTIKAIQDIKVGDQIMGRDNTPRTVLKLHNGYDDMYEIEQKMFKNYTVNSKHDVYFKKWGTYKNNKGNRRTLYDESKAKDVVIEAKELYKKAKGYFHTIYGVGVDGWELPEKKLLIEPYWLGYWLGDGDSKKPVIATIDSEIIEYVYDYAKRLDLKIWHLEDSIVYGLYTPDWMKPKEGSNVMLTWMRKYNILGNKHIPIDYLTGSREQRLQLLAGLIDSDGHNPKDKKNSIVFTQKNVEFIKQVQRLCWSLGFRANYAEHTYKTKYKKGGIATTAQLHISGNLTHIPCKIKRKKITETFDEPKSPTRRGLDIKYVGKNKYYGFTCDKDHMFILEDGTVVKNSFEFTYALPTWRLYRYRKPHSFIPDTWDNKNSKETVIITNESRLGKKHLEKVVSEIESNDLLGAKLRPDGGAKGIEKFVAKNGALIELRSFGSFIRGLHVGTVIVDDFLDKSAIYSQEQREKFKEVFYAEIKNIVEPYGNLIVSGTPFSKNDLYNDIKIDPLFKVFEYPGIYKSGQLLAPDRFNFKQLMELRKSLGSIVFAREILVTPIDDASSIFPWEFLNKAFVNMERINLVENIESFPIKLTRVVVGCDFAISGNIGADYSVFSVWGADQNKNYYLLHVWRKQGASHNEQVSQIVRINNAFKPNVIVCEKNNIGQVLIPLIIERGVTNVREFVTGINKRDLYQGLPSLSAMFERGDIKIPYGNEKSKNIASWLCGEFNSIGFDEDKGKLESMDGHDDGVMSSWFALSELRDGQGAFKIHYI